MGADLITVSWTSEGRPDYELVRQRITELPKAAIDVLMAGQPLGYCSTEEEVHAVLREGFAEYELSVLGDHRYTTYEVISKDTRYYTSGGESWGDDPYDGWSSLVSFLDACEADDDLARAAGFIGFGIHGADEVTPLMQAVATALELEGLNPDMIARVLDRVAAATQN